MTDDEIRTIFLANGFTIKEGQDDLKPYVFQAARALMEAERQACANVCHELALRYGNGAEGAGEPHFTIFIASEAAAHHCEKGILGRKP